MKINWLIRFKNKAFLVTIITLIITFVYQLLALFDVVPSITQDKVMGVVTLIINLLATLGVIVDPTTDGVGDSDQALTYGKEVEK